MLNIGREMPVLERPCCVRCGTAVRSAVELRDAAAELGEVLVRARALSLQGRLGALELEERAVGVVLDGSAELEAELRCEHRACGDVGVRRRLGRLEEDLAAAELLQ